MERSSTHGALARLPAAQTNKPASLPPRDRRLSSSLSFCRCLSRRPHAVRTYMVLESFQPSDKLILSLIRIPMFKPNIHGLIFVPHCTSPARPISPTGVDRQIRFHLATAAAAPPGRPCSLNERTRTDERTTDAMQSVSRHLALKDGRTKERERAREREREKEGGKKRKNVRSGRNEAAASQTYVQAGCDRVRPFDPNERLALTKSKAHMDGTYLDHVRSSDMQYSYESDLRRI